MKNFEIKSISGTVADVDEKSRRVKVAVSEMESKDLDNDVITSGAYEKTIKERGPKGAGLIWHLTDHTASLTSAVGKPSDVYAENNKLLFVTNVNKTSWGNDVLEMYKSGVINQHSIGFRIIKQEPINAGKNDEYRLIKEVLLYEGSAVLWGANQNTPTLSVGKSATKEEREKNFFEAVKELSNLAKLFRHGHLSDESFELIEMHMAQKTEILQQLYRDNIPTQPAEKSAVEPEKGKSVLDVLTTFNNILILQNNARKYDRATVS